MQRQEPGYINKDNELGPAPLRPNAVRSGWARYALAIAVQTASIALIVWLSGFFPIGHFPIVYVVPMLAIALYLGEGPTFVTFLITLAAMVYYFVPPDGFAFPAGQHAWATLIAYFLCTGVMMVSIAVVRRTRQHERELDAHKQDFYKRTILAATQGKLLVTDRPDILRIVGEPFASWHIRHPDDLERIRKSAVDLVTAAGIGANQLLGFLSCIGESTSNAWKHAQGGMASLHRTGDTLFLVVSDKGRGIDALNLPDVALLDSYSTAGTLGMGYKLMIASSDRVYLATGPEGTTVAMEMKLSNSKDPDRSSREAMSI